MSHRAQVLLLAVRGGPVRTSSSDQLWGREAQLSRARWLVGGTGSFVSWGSLASREGEWLLV